MIPTIDTLPTDDERAAIKAEARRYIQERLRENAKLFEADLLAILRRHGKPGAA